MADKQKSEIATYLIQQGTNVAQVSRECGHTALELAVAYGFIKVTKVLLSAHRSSLNSAILFM
jgi:ankyrin repeat protein